MRLCRLTFVFVFGALAASAFAAGPSAPDTHDTRMLSEPAVSAEQIAFICASDLWVCGLDGKNVCRLTADVGAESSPAFSPDGKWIAFSAQYEGNTDVYVVSADGGIPRRTWQPGADIVQEFTPDGRGPQVEKAIAVVLDELKRNPSASPKRPPYPAKARSAGGAGS